MATLNREQAKQEVELISNSYVRFNSSVTSDSFRAREIGLYDLRHADKRLERTIGQLSSDLNIILTIGDNPMYGSVFRKGPYDFLVEDCRTLGGPDEVGPRESLTLTDSHWITSAIERARWPYFGNGWVEIGGVALAEALAENASLTVVDKEVADAVAIKF